MRTCRYRKGFTLVELLVVVAIIAVLAGIIFPVFARARARAESTTCQSNLRQLGAAFQQYLNEFDDQYPNSWRTQRSPYGELNHSWWDVLIYPYVRSDAVFACPANDTPSYSVHQAFDSRGLKTRRVTYALNNQLLGAAAGVDKFQYVGDPPDPALASDVDDPASTILLAEKMQDYPGHTPSQPNQPGNQSQEVDVWFQLTEPGITPPDWDTSWGVARSLHGLGSNFLFVDGHVKFLRLQDTFTGGKPAMVTTGADRGGTDTGIGGSMGPAPPPSAPPSVGATGPAEQDEGTDMWRIRRIAATGQ
jgi:prepilin-type N-terminal cleavage/methylation domain-containing protein/prepilin-type processing-associated H-X9-DG protein